MEIKLPHYLINELPKGSKVYICPLDSRMYNKVMSEFHALQNANSVNKFTDNYGFHPSEIIMDGACYINANDKEELESVNGILARILPAPTYVNNAVTHRNENSYKCFCCQQFDLEDVTEHRTPLESWNCLITYLGDPEYAIVIERKKNHE